MFLGRTILRLDWQRSPCSKPSIWGVASAGLAREGNLPPNLDAVGRAAACSQPGRNDEMNRFGPRIDNDHTIFRLWAPGALAAELIIEGAPPVALQRAEGGFHEARVQCGPGTRYKFRVGDKIFPDIASRRQADDAAGWNVVCAPLAPASQGEIRPWHEAVICEVHVGAATPQGTFEALRQRLEHFRDAGFTCLEIMPVNEFPGARNWGYDGTLIFAPDSSYGTPEELRALVDRAHELGLCMILDVVYNHFGQVDNFLQSYAPEWFDEDIDTPWDRRSISPKSRCGSSTTRMSACG